MLDYEKLNVYQKSLAFFTHEEEMTATWPNGLAVTDELSRACPSILSNLAMAVATRSTKLRVHQLDYALGSALECAACLDVAYVMKLIEQEVSQARKADLANIARMLVGLRKAWLNRVKEPRQEYSAGDVDDFSTWFPHEKMDVYQVSLQVVEWFHRAVFSTVPKSRISSQLDKQTCAVVLHIAEGNGRFHALDHRTFLTKARHAAVKAGTLIDMIEATPENDFSDGKYGKVRLDRVVTMLAALSGYLEEERDMGR